MKALILFHLVSYTFLFLGCFCFAGTGDWSNWRGPNYNGSTSDSFSYPEKFSIKDEVKWSFELPGSSASTPVVNDDLVFLSTVSAKSETEDGELLAICLDRKSGKLIWRKNVGSGYQPGNGDGLTHKLDSKSNYHCYFGSWRRHELRSWRRLALNLLVMQWTRLTLMCVSVGPRWNSLVDSVNPH